MYVMPPAARGLHDPPMHAHGLLAADHHRLVEVGIADFALVERQLDPLPICVIVLIGTGNVVHGNGLPSFGETLLFFVRPFDLRLYRRRVLLSFLPPLQRRRGLRHVVLLVEVVLLLFFFIDVLGVVSEHVVLIIDGTPHRDSFRRPCLSFGARGFLAFSAPLSAIFFGGMVVEEKRRSCNYGGIQRGKWVYMAHFGEKRNKWRGTTLPMADTAGPLDVSRVLVSSGVLERASESRGWHGLSGWMKAQIRAKTRNRGRDWAE
jgi:hypothetical protein